MNRNEPRPTDHSTGSAPPDDRLPLPGGGCRSSVVSILGFRSKTTVSGSREQRIGQVAERQRGRIRRTQLLEIGIGPNVIDRLIRSGALIRVHAGVYAVAHLAAIPLGDETAALLALRDGAVLGLFTAAELWGLEIPRFGDRMIHTVLGGAPGGRPRGVRVHRVELHHRLTDGELEELLHRSTGRPGAANIRSAIGRDDPPGFTASMAERRLLEILAAADLPTPVVNHPRGRYIPDFAWPDQGVILELDDWRSHRTSRTFDSDRLRDATHAARGLQTIRVTLRQLRDEPFAVIARLAAALAIGAWQRAATDRHPRAPA